MKIRILHASVNPMYYDTKELAQMDYNTAVSYFENDGINCCYVSQEEIDITESSERLYAPDGILGGDDSDVNFVWVKVTLS